jgi:hypothetical protein
MGIARVERRARLPARSAFRDGQHIRELGTRLGSVFGQSREALLSKVGDQIKFASFKQVPGGYVFRAPNPKVFGRSDHYLVDEAQRDKIVAIMTPRRPGVLLAAWVGGCFLTAAVAVVWLAVFAPGFPVTVLLVLIAAMLLAAILGYCLCWVCASTGGTASAAAAVPR